MGMGRRADRELQLEWDGQTISWPTQNVQSLIGMDLNLVMLGEDLGMQLWGQFNKLAEVEERSNVAFAVIEDCSADLAEVLAACLPDHDNYRRPLAGRLREFVRMVATELVHCGKIDFEICLGREVNKPGSKPRAAMLRYVPRDSLIKIGRECFQVIPEQKEISQRQKVVSVSNERVCRFLPPIGRRAALAGARASLPRIGESQHRWMLERMSRRGGEDFGEGNRSYKIATARAARSFGWNGRGLFSDEIADFHWAIRELRWRRFGIEVRDQILLDLGECFRRIGKAFGENPRLTVKNLPTLQQVEEAQTKLMAGGTRFDVLFEHFP
jgi:hypothetical protein